MLSAKFCTVLAVLGTTASAQISMVSMNFSGDEVYFTTYLSQRGSSQPSLNKLFSLRNTSLTLLEQSRTDLPALSMDEYKRTALSASGSVRAINRLWDCVGGSSCLFTERASTTIQTPAARLTFSGNACLSANGRFAVLYGNTNQAPGTNPPPGSVRLVDLQSGQPVRLGGQAAQDGQMVADDGTVLVAREGGIRLIGTAGNTDLTVSRAMNRALLSADAARIIYDVRQAPFEIRTIEVATGVDRSLGPGRLPMLAADGHRFTYLNSVDGLSQVWLGDALTGASQPLTNESEGIYDQNISGDGATIVAVSNTARLLSINAVTGVITQLLDSPGPRASLLAQPVPGSYNELLGDFPAGSVPEILVGESRPIVLGPTKRGIAIQIPWELPPDPKVNIVMRFKEPAWEQLLATGVYTAYGTPLLVSARNSSTSYALHEDWSGLVTFETPARPNEIIHMYGTGYGPVDGIVANGKPTPADRPYQITPPCSWLAGPKSDARSIEVPFAGLAPSLVGIYQFDFRIPPDWPYKFFNPSCQSSDPFYLLYMEFVDVQP